MPLARSEPRFRSAPTLRSICTFVCLLALVAFAAPSSASVWGYPMCTVAGDQAPVVLVPATLPGVPPQVGAFAIWVDARDTQSSPSHLYWKWLGPDVVDAVAPTDGQPLVQRPGSQSGVSAGMVTPGSCGNPSGCTSLVAAYLDSPDPSSTALRLVRMDDFSTAWDVEIAGNVDAFGNAHGVVAAGDGAGGPEGVIVGWVAATAQGPTRLRAQRISADGVPLWGPEGEWVVPDSSVYQSEVAMAPSPGGGAYLAWQDNRTSPDWSIYLARLGLDGAPSPGWPAGGLPVRVDGHALDHIHVVPDAGDGVFVLWTEFREASGGTLIPQTRVLHRLGDGSVAPGWPADGAWLFDRPGVEFSLDVLDVRPDRMGGIVALTRTDEPRMLVQRLQADGSFPAGWPAAGTEVSSIPGLPMGGHLSVEADGEVTAVWSDASEGWDSMYLLGARFLPDASRPEGWPEIGITVARTGGTDEPLTVPGADGSVLVAWPDLRNTATSGTDLFAQVVGPEGRGNVGVGEPAPLVALELVFANAQPARGDIAFRLSLPRAGHVTAEVFDLLGRRLATLVDGTLPAGAHELAWRGAGDGGPGVRFLRVRTPAGERTLRFVTLR